MRRAPTRDYRSVQLYAVVLVSLSLGCSAAGIDEPAVGDRSPGGAAGMGGGGTNGPREVELGVGPAVIEQCVAGEETSGPMPVRRLSAMEYAGSVRDVFGTVVNWGDLPADELHKSFVSNVSKEVTSDHLARYLALANRVAADVAANFPERSGCAGDADRACVEAFLVTRARRAFHGVLEDQDRQRLLDLYGQLLSTTDAATALRAAIRFTLLSPRFLYLVDFGTAVGERAALSASELAGRMAAFLWRSVPDDALLAAADAGELAAAADIERQAARMLDDPRAADVLRRLATELLGLTTTGSDPLSVQVDAESGNLFAELTLSGTGTFADLLTTTAMIGGSDQLLDLYGATSEQAPPERAGLLRRAGFLRTHASGGRPSPIKRGHAVRKAFFCEVVAPPSGGINMNLPVPAAGETDREAFGLHSREPGCWACHQWMDPLGHSFADYDATGAYAASGADLSAVLYPSSGVGLPQTTYADTQALTQAIADGAFSQQCFALQVARFATGRAEGRADACALKEVWEGFEGSGLNLRQLVVELVSSSHFRYRSVSKPGGACQ